MIAKWKAAKVTCACRSFASSKMRLLTKTFDGSSVVVYFLGRSSLTMLTVDTVLTIAQNQNLLLRPVFDTRGSLSTARVAASSSSVPSKKGLASSCESSIETPFSKSRSPSAIVHVDQSMEQLVVRALLWFRQGQISCNTEAWSTFPGHPRMITMLPCGYTFDDESRPSSAYHALAYLALNRRLLHYGRRRRGSMRQEMVRMDTYPVQATGNTRSRSRQVD